ncbi:MAG: Holliday junction DNA helicase RuvA [Candidatus Zambryskibacteria bacterium RIFCSPHIGHO2_12_FULL_48_10]|uniref:Holliday junction branch migration complex subunit RuvA n=1 Tax=Candidatus Zambryskibacteria bacterium RIFCSPHIGHO2_01_FULL_46_25 TaxID=1802738 RepID=A0A1G2SYG2_9BACT|nr:MAG: Holliday junction ATP-dependent DNA helicase RuvA [Parcubacteria group bacterium GW2011_GWA1_47_10]OHA90025.1 MAG: Holliday junction DNA helicase RuvA [Candidatus Zambryskibacteria bacterium RIFCSPHIGHO2_01_FULL_46_25]OHB01228.1 MAG: Holliday junction DNA helicase RuvA [Candidatus Zambryskibacteria bacterium RIFCSPHIGHO2_12_FULL_48_10]OHB06601.1 MAG: Holliday junction DNA helicase RuvA [Candidatus Zambryskibacteria bacterium RIFCSPLOWO2_01_FULL_48_25]
MISSLSGTVRYKDLHSVVIDIGGVGYKVAVTTDVALEAQPSSPIFLWTHLAVRENALDLYGFPDKETLEVFELLITIPGIGPKTALGIMNVASPSMLRQAVASGDTTYLTRVSGIGKKNAEKIVLELRDKLKITETDASTGSAQVRAEGDALEALVSLGYSERDAREALKRVPKEIQGAAERVKHSLKILSTKS